MLAALRATADLRGLGLTAEDVTIGKPSRSGDTLVTVDIDGDGRADISFTLTHSTASLSDFWF